MAVLILVWLGGAVIALAALYEYLAGRVARNSSADPEAARQSQITLAGGIAMLALAVVLYHVLLGNGLGQTAALFIGIPALAAMAAVFAPARTALGVAMKAVTIGLLISMVFLGEGAVCVLMSAPLFYLVALLIGWAVGGIRSSNNRNQLFPWIAMMSMLPMSVEGVMPMTTFSRDVIVSQTRIVNASAAAIEAAIEQAPRFDRALPPFLAIGFPTPTATRIDGDRWTIRMRGGEMRLNGMEMRAGDLVLERDSRGATFTSWRAVVDDSHMTHFLNWQTSRVEWSPIDAHTTRVTWTLRYRRGLDPAWYFGPMERYAMHLAAGYLIDSVATP